MGGPLGGHRRGRLRSVRLVADHGLRGGSDVVVAFLRDDQSGRGSAHLSHYCAIHVPTERLHNSPRIPRLAFLLKFRSRCDTCHLYLICEFQYHAKEVIIKAL